MGNGRGNDGGNEREGIQDDMTTGCLMHYEHMKNLGQEATTGSGVLGHFHGGGMMEWSFGYHFVGLKVEECI